jgi:chromosome segregation ATPase
MRTVNIDKLSFVGRKIRKTRVELTTLCAELKSIEKSFNLSKGALKSWQEAYATMYDKKIRKLQEENSSLKEELEKLNAHI